MSAKTRASVAGIYLPKDEMARFGVSEDDILQGRYSPAFLRLMNFQHQRARRYDEEAAAVLPASDRYRMVAARMMARIYGDILEKLKHTGFRVFDRREKLSKLHKGVILGGYLVQRLAAPGVRPNVTSRPGCAWRPVSKTPATRERPEWWGVRLAFCSWGL